MSSDRFLRPADFGRLCGFNDRSPGTKISVYVKRGKLTANEQGLLDIKNPKNKAFIAKSLSQNLHKEIEKTYEGNINEEKGLKKNSEFTFEFNPDGSVDIDSLKPHIYSLTDIKALEDIRLKQASVRLKDIEELKLKGKMIDADYAAESLFVFAQTFMRMMSDNLNSWIIDFGHRNKLKNEEISRLTSESKKHINKSYEDSLHVAEEKMVEAKKETVKDAKTEIENKN